MGTKAVSKYTRPPPDYAGVGPHSPDLRKREFERITVTGFAGRNKHGSYLWYCDCKCGTKHKPVLGSSLTGHHTRSCGCLRNERSAAANSRRGAVGDYLALRAVGLAVSEIARRHGVSRQAVHMACKRRGVKPEVGAERNGK